MLQNPVRTTNFIEIARWLLQFAYKSLALKHLTTNSFSHLWLSIPPPPKKKKNKKL